MDIYRRTEGKQSRPKKMATMIDERDRDTRIIVAEGYKTRVEEIRKILEDIFKKRDIVHEIRTVDMGYFQRGGKAVIKDIILASWLGYNMVKNAFDKCDSGYYSAYNGGQQPSILSLELALSPESNHIEIPEEILAFSRALE